MQLNRKPRTQRNGTVLIVALLVLSCVLLLGAALARTVLLFRAHREFGHTHQQTLLLMDSAVQRATHAATHNQDYVGETWQVPPESLAPGASATVVIRLDKYQTETDLQRLLVEVNYSQSGAGTVNSIRELVIKRKVEKNSDIKESAL